jgi:hypothetical protein
VASELVIGTAVGLSLLVTFLLVTTDVHHHAKKARFWVCAVSSLRYFAFLGMGNAVSTVFVPVMAPSSVNAWFDTLAVWVRPFVYAVIGVFAFRGVVSRLTFSVSGKSAERHYTFRHQVDMARASAVEEAVDRQIVLDNRLQQQRAWGLRTLLHERDLNAYIIQHLGAGVVRRYEEQARKENADALTLKASVLAGLRPTETASIVREAKKQQSWWRRPREPAPTPEPEKQ